MEKATRVFEQSDSRGTVRIEVDYLHGRPPEAAELRELASQGAAESAEGGMPPSYADDWMARQAEALESFEGPTDIVIRASIQAVGEDKPRTIELTAGEFHTFVKSVRRNLPSADTGSILAGMPRRVMPRQLGRAKLAS